MKWCIADVPKELSDKIRREAYITNEIIIKQEALRAQGLHNKNGERAASKLDVLGVGDCPSTPEHWDRFIEKSLSASEFDLIVHGNQSPSCSKFADSLLKSPTSV